MREEDQNKLMEVLQAAQRRCDKAGLLPSFTGQARSHTYPHPTFFDMVSCVVDLMYTRHTDVTKLIL